MEICVSDGFEVIGFTAPSGVFAAAQRPDSELDAFLAGEILARVEASAGLPLQPRYGLDDPSDMDAFLIPGGIGTRREMHNKRLLDFVPALPPETIRASVCTGTKIYGKDGTLDDLRATSRKSSDLSENRIPIDRLAKIAPACALDRHRVVDQGALITAGGVSAGRRTGFHLLPRFGHDEAFVDGVAKIMEYERERALMEADRLLAAEERYLSDRRRCAPGRVMRLRDGTKKEWFAPRGIRVSLVVAPWSSGRRIHWRVDWHSASRGRIRRATKTGEVSRVVPVLRDREPSRPRDGSSK